MLNLLRSGDFKMIIIYLIAVLLSLSIHEMAHALASYWLGDTTAKSSGRISLNPFHHIDWTGFICLLLFGFGWAQPVPINPYEYKDPRLGTAWSAFAGPLANFILAFVCIFCFDLLALFSRSFVMTSFGSFLISLLSTTALMSTGFGVFNLIPIPPLDGAKVFWAFLPDRYYFRLNNPPTWITLAFFVLIASGLFVEPLNLMRSTLVGWMDNGALWLIQTLFIH